MQTVPDDAALACHTGDGAQTACRTGTHSTHRPAQRQVLDGARCITKEADRVIDTVFWKFDLKATDRMFLTIKGAGEEMILADSDGRPGLPAQVDIAGQLHRHIGVAVVDAIVHFPGKSHQIFSVPISTWVTDACRVTLRV